MKCEEGILGQYYGHNRQLCIEPDSARAHIVLLNGALLKLLCCFSTRLVIFGTMLQRKTIDNIYVVYIIYGKTERWYQI